MKLPPSLQISNLLIILGHMRPRPIGSSILKLTRQVVHSTWTTADKDEKSKVELCGRILTPTKRLRVIGGRE